MLRPAHHSLRRPPITVPSPDCSGERKAICDPFTSGSKQASPLVVPRRVYALYACTSGPSSYEEPWEGDVSALTVTPCSSIYGGLSIEVHKGKVIAWHMTLHDDWIFM